VNARLALHGIHDGLPTVPRVHDDRPAGRVQIGPPVLIPDRGALGPSREGQFAVEHSLEDSTCVGGLLDGHVGIAGRAIEEGPQLALPHPQWHAAQSDTGPD
jgi:hypothetical protein